LIEARMKFASHLENSPSGVSARFQEVRINNGPKTAPWIVVEVLYSQSSLRLAKRAALRFAEDQSEVSSTPNVFQEQSSGQK